MIRTLVLALLVAAFARPAEACSCLRREIDEAYAGSDVVVVATIVAQLENDDSTGMRHRVFDVQVESAWKGKAKYAMKVATGFGGGDCGRHLKKDQKWIFFLNEHMGMTFTSICDNSVLWSKDEMAKMVKKFGAPKNPKS